MTSSLAGTVAHGARGGRGVSTSHFCRIFPGLSGTPRYSLELPGSGSHNIIMGCPTKRSRSVLLYALSSGLL